MMATAPTSTKGIGGGPPVEGPRSREQLRRDRVVALVIVAMFIALMALMIWLASFGEAPPVDTDFWMMP